MDVDKNILINVYGIDDNNFVTYLNKFNTLKKVFNLGAVKFLPAEKVRELYNSFIYYFSLGHNMDTIVNDTLPIVKKLFFLNGEGNLKYKLPDDERFEQNSSYVHIVGRVCHIKLNFITTQEIKNNTVFFNFIPSPTLVHDSIISTSKGYVLLSIRNEGLLMIEDTLPVNTAVRGNLTYIVDK